MADVTLDAEQKKILEVLKSQKESVGPGEISTASGVDKTKVANKLKTLKDKGLIDSPIRCKYSITPAGIDLLGK